MAKALSSSFKRVGEKTLTLTQCQRAPNSLSHSWFESHPNRCSRYLVVQHTRAHTNQSTWCKPNNRFNFLTSWKPVDTLRFDQKQQLRRASKHCSFQFSISLLLLFKLIQLNRAFLELFRERYKTMSNNLLLNSEAEQQ